VARFVPRDHAASPCDRADSGSAYIVWLSRERARDVARRWWRSARHSRAFSQLGRDTVNDLRTRLAGALERNDDPEPLPQLIIRLHESIEQLEPLEQAVIALLIEGKTQAVIAHVLGVCEGTVSRIRSGAIVRLRALMDPRPPDAAATPHADAGPPTG
jgi:RNA polymerase sigma factor (sigma-70 family)